MYNKYEKPTKIVHKLCDLEGDEIRYAFAGVQETRIGLKGIDTVAIVGQEDAIFLHALHELTTALNETTGSGLTVPEFLAKALEKEGLDASAIRACNKDVGHYEEPVVYQDRERPTVTRIKEVASAQRRVLLYPKKKLHDLDEARFAGDERDVISGLIREEEADCLNAIRETYAAANDQGLQAVFADAHAFKNHIVETLLFEFCDASQDPHINGRLVEGFKAGSTMRLGIKSLSKNEDAEYYLLAHRREM